MLPPRPPSQGCVGSASLRRRAFVKSAAEQGSLQVHSNEQSDLPCGRQIEPRSQAKQEAKQESTQLSTQQKCMESRLTHAHDEEDSECESDFSDDSGTQSGSLQSLKNLSSHAGKLSQNFSHQAPSKQDHGVSIAPTQQGNAHRPPALSSPCSLSSCESDDGEPLSPFRENEGVAQSFGNGSHHHQHQKHQQPAATTVPATATNPPTDARGQAIALLMQRQLELAARARAAGAAGAAKAAGGGAGPAAADGGAGSAGDEESERRRERLRERVRSVLSDDEQVLSVSVAG